MQKTVLILGARGRLGAALVSAFAHAGWRVLAHTRAGAALPVVGAMPMVPKPTALAPNAPTALPLQHITAELTDTTAFARLGPIDVVVHALNPTYTLWPTQAMPLLESAIGLSLQLGASLMFPGNVYNFGDSMPGLLRESTAQRPSTGKGKIRCAMELRLQQAAAPLALLQNTAPLALQEGKAQPRLRSVVIRAGDFFGSGTGSWFDLLVAKGAPKGRMGYAGPRGIATAWAYVPDLAQAFVQVAQRSTQLAPFEVLHFAGHHLRREDWQQAMGRVLASLGWLPAGQKPKVQSMPWPLIRALAWAVPNWREIAELRYLWLTPHALDGSKLASLIGPEPHTPLDTALRQSLQQLYPNKV